MRPWQEAAEELMVNQGPREILFIVDRIGAMGKTWFASYMMKKYGAIIFDCSLM